MEEKLIGEQPKEVLDEVQSGIVENVEEGITHISNEGSLGKFKDAESLLKAYNNLQAEFTKKCQKLSELTKSFAEENSAVASDDCEDKSESLNKNMPEENNEVKNKTLTQPIFKSKDWNTKVAEFLNANEPAKEFSNQIANEILNDQSLQNNENALDLAWARVMQKEFASPDKLASDQNFIREKILSNNQIKWQIINEYFKDIQSKKVPPLITSSGVVAGVTVKEPTTMAEAKEVVQKLFNLKGK